MLCAESNILQKSKSITFMQLHLLTFCNLIKEWHQVCFTRQIFYKAILTGKNYTSIISVFLLFWLGLMSVQMDCTCWVLPTCSFWILSQQQHSSSFWNTSIILKKIDICGLEISPANSFRALGTCQLILCIPTKQCLTFSLVTNNLESSSIHVIWYEYYPYAFQYENRKI